LRKEEISKVSPNIKKMGSNVRANELLIECLFKKQSNSWFRASLTDFTDNSNEAHVFEI
jgi:hypothetical protein